MPEAAEIDPFVLELGDLDDFWKTVDAAHERVFDRLAEAAGERQEACGRQALAVAEDHAVVEQSAADFGDRRFRQLRGQIDAVQFDAERAGDRPHLDRHGDLLRLPAA